jgi:8-oxo-dGTP pyrophosphatase MutT (NUDIX family)
MGAPNGPTAAASTGRDPHPDSDLDRGIDALPVPGREPNAPAAGPDGSPTAADASAPPGGHRRVGRRLVADAEIPPWMRTLAAATDGHPLPGLLHTMTLEAPPTARRGAVLMLFGDGPFGPDLLLTGRAPTMRSHAGQPAFPGGAIDPGEDAIEAALREGQEETGLLPDTVLPVALFPELYLPPSEFMVRPVLAYWREPGEVAPVDPAETAVVARVPVRDLVDPVNRGTVRHPSGFESPAFQVADLLVWGFTAGLVDVLLTLGGWSVPWDRDRFFELADFS